MVRMRSQCVARTMMRSDSVSSEGEHLLFCLLPTNQDLPVWYFLIYFSGNLRNLCACRICLSFRWLCAVPASFLEIVPVYL